MSWSGSAILSERLLRLAIMGLLLQEHACVEAVEAWMRCSVDPLFRPLCHRSRSGPFFTGETLVLTTVVFEPLLCYAWTSGPVVQASQLWTSPNSDPTTSGALPYELVHVIPLEVTGAYVYLLSCNSSQPGPAIPLELYRPTPMFFGDHSLFSPLPSFSVSGRQKLLAHCEACRTGAEPGQWLSREWVPSCAVDANRQWFEGDPVWLPRGCVYPFLTREQLYVGPPVEVIVIGDSLMRGIFCDLQNWLWRKHYPSALVGTLQLLEGYQATTWDAAVCGFNRG